MNNVGTLLRLFDVGYLLVDSKSWIYMVCYDFEGFGVLCITTKVKLLCRLLTLSFLLIVMGNLNWLLELGLMERLLCPVNFDQMGLKILDLLKVMFEMIEVERRELSPLVTF